MKIAIYILFMLAQSLNPRAQAQWQQGPEASRQNAIGNLMDTWSRDRTSDWQQDCRPDPGYTLKIVIRQTTTLKDLLKIRRKIGRKLGLSILYHRIDYDSCGLRTIEIELISPAGVHPLFQWTRTSDPLDTGILDITRMRNGRMDVAGPPLAVRR